MALAAHAAQARTQVGARALARLVEPLGHFVDAARIERMAARETPQGQPAPGQRAVPFDGLQRVVGATRQEPAARRKKRADASR